MYRYKLDIVLLSRDPRLERIVRAQPPLEHFIHEIEVLETFSAEAAARADLLLLDQTPAISLSGLRVLCKPQAVLVACLTPTEVDSVPEEDLDAAEELWEKTLEERLTALRFRRLLKWIKLKADFLLTRTYLDTAIDSIPDMIWFKAKDGTHVKVNKAFCHTVGKRREDVTGKDHCYIWDMSREEFERGEFVCKETEEIVMRRRETCQFTEKVKSQHGMRQFRTYKSPLFDENGEIMGTVGIGHDVTDLENMSAELEIILRSMPFAILVWDNDGIVVDANEKFERYFGVNRESLIGGRYDAWGPGVIMKSEQLNREGYPEFRVVPSDEREERVLETHEEPIYDVFQTEVGRLCIFRDVTVERALEEQLLQNLNTDFLTGLYNRRYFYQYMMQERGKRPVSLLYLDLDRFKEVNDTHGHQVGDQALKKTARLLRDYFKDAFIARLGGDEFIVAYLGRFTPERLEELAQGFQRYMEEHFQAMPWFRILSACVGIAQAEAEDGDIDALLQRSDTALYAAKEKGMAQCCIYGQNVAERT